MSMSTKAVACDPRVFARAIDLAASVVERGHQIPVLGCVKVSANGSLKVEGTDLDMLVSAEVDHAGGEIEAVSLRAPREVARAVRQLGGEVLYFANSGEKAVALSTGRFDAALACLPGEDYPVMEPIGEVDFTAEIGAGELAALARVMPAISTEETRYYLNGVCVEKIGEWTWRFVATDGHRMMVQDVALPGARGAIADRSILPRRFVELVLRHFAKTKEPVLVSYGRQRRGNAPDADLAPGAGGVPLVSVEGFVKGAMLTLTSKLIDGTYPDYRRVIPKDFAHTIRLDRRAMMRAVRGLSPLSQTKTRAVAVNAVPGGLRLSLHSVDLGDAAVEIEAEHGLPDGRVFGANGGYLLSCLEALRGDEVQLDLQEHTDSAPIVIRDPADTDFLSVLMPMRV